MHYKNCRPYELFKAERLAEGGMEWIFDSELYMEDEFVMDTRCDCMCRHSLIDTSCRIEDDEWEEHIKSLKVKRNIICLIIRLGGR